MSSYRCSFLWWIVYGVPLILFFLLPKNIRKKLQRKYSSFYNEQK